MVDDPRDLVRTNINLTLDALKRAALAKPNKKAQAEWTALAGVYAISAVRRMVEMLRDG